LAVQLDRTPWPFDPAPVADPIAAGNRLASAKRAAEYNVPLGFERSDEWRRS
jgi:hypothetical protein